MRETFSSKPLYSDLNNTIENSDVKSISKRSGYSKRRRKNSKAAAKAIGKFMTGGSQNIQITIDDEDVAQLQRSINSHYLGARSTKGTLHSA